MCEVNSRTGQELHVGTQKQDKTFTVTEPCPHCGYEIEMRGDTDTLGFQAFCPVCGQRLMLCDECRYADQSTPCDYSGETDKCHRMPRQEDAADERIIILELNHFANLCGRCFNACMTEPELPVINNGYNCAHPEQEETVEESGKVIGCCYGWSCPLGYPPSRYDLVKYGVIEEDGDCGDDVTDYDYIIVTDVEIIRRLRERGVAGLAGRSVREAELWESTRNEAMEQSQ